MSRRAPKVGGSKITKPQKFKLLEMMKESPELEYGNRGVNYMKKPATREVAVRRWKEIAKELNLMNGGTAQKEWQGWRKTWSDIRSKMQDDWSLVIQLHLNQTKKNSKLYSSNNNKINLNNGNEEEEHVVTVPKVEPESEDESSSGTDSDLMTNHDGPKILHKININSIRLKNNIKEKNADDNDKNDNDDDNNNNNDEDVDDDEDDEDDDNEEEDDDDDEDDNEQQQQQEEEQSVNNYQRNTRSKANLNKNIVDPPVIPIRTKPLNIRQQTNGTNDRVKKNFNNSENLKKITNSNERTKKIPNIINERAKNIQNNCNEKKKKKSFTSFMKQYVERKAKVKENYYARKLQLLQRDVFAKESIASSLRILADRKRNV